MSTHTVDAEEVIGGYKAAVEHANGPLFASELKVSHADGWFTVRDLDGSESRYRQKELLSLTRQLLKQPVYKPESLSDIFAEVAVSRKAEAPIQKPAIKPPSQLLEPIQVNNPHLHSFAESAPPEAKSSLLSVLPDSHSEVALPATSQPTPSVAEAGSLPASAEPARKVISFPIAKPAGSPAREIEERAYKSNLKRIFFIVAMIFAGIIVFLILRGK